MKEIRIEETINPLVYKDTEVKKQIEETITQKIKEENKRAEEEKQKVKEEVEKAKKSMISEEDLKVLLLMFGSRGGSQLLERIIEERKKQSKLPH